VIESWHIIYVDYAVFDALSPPGLRFAIRLVFVESLRKTVDFGRIFGFISQRLNEY
jgi:hypothetical protein